MGAVSFVFGTAGTTYTTDGKVYELTGWTFEAIGAHELFLEKRAEEALSRRAVTGDTKAETLAILCDRAASFKYSYGGEIFTESLKSFGGLGHFFWQLAKGKTPTLTLQQAVKMVQDDPAGISKAVHEADPQNRATAENPKQEDGQAS